MFKTIWKPTKTRQPSESWWHIPKLFLLLPPKCRRVWWASTIDVYQSALSASCKFLLLPILFPRFAVRFIYEDYMMPYNYPSELKTSRTWTDIFICAVLQVGDALQANFGRLWIHQETPTTSELLKNPISVTCACKCILVHSSFLPHSTFILFFPPICAFYGPDIVLGAPSCHLKDILNDERG